MRRASVYLFFSLFCLGIFFAHISYAAGPTKISYSVDTPSTWTKENSPYIVQNHVVVKAPLTIEPGTVVKFSINNLADLTLQNDFYVKGTREEPVIFTSIRDDSYMGDNDGDHGYYKPCKEDWMGLNFNPYQDYVLEIEYAKIMYSAFGISIYSSNNHYKSRTVKNCEMKNNGYGILVYNTEPVIENNLITNNQFGIGVSASSKVTKITNNSIYDNETGAKGNNSINPDSGRWMRDTTGGATKAARTVPIIQMEKETKFWAKCFLIHGLRKILFKLPIQLLLFPGLWALGKRTALGKSIPFFTLMTISMLNLPPMDMFLKKIYLPFPMNGGTATK